MPYRIARTSDKNWVIVTDVTTKKSYHLRTSVYTKNLKSEAFEKWLNEEEGRAERILHINPRKCVVEAIPKDIAKFIIKKNHYSHSIQHAPWPLGLFTFPNQDYKRSWLKECELTMADHRRLSDEDNFDISSIPHLHGILIFAHPVAVTAWKSISPLITKPTEVVELTRLFVADRHPSTGKNVESWFIGQGLKWLQKNKPEVKCVISYADPAETHMGSIYQATNFLCQVISFSESKEWTFSRDGGKTWSHFRRSAEKYGRTLDDFKKTVPRPFLARKHNKKIRYIKFLTGKTETKNLMASLKHLVIPYDDIQADLGRQVIEVK